MSGLLSSELRLMVRRGRRVLVGLAVATGCWVALFVCVGERGHEVAPAGCDGVMCPAPTWVEPLTTSQMLGRSDSVSERLVPVAGLVSGSAVALAGRRARRSADEAFIRVPGRVIGPVVVGIFRGLTTAALVGGLIGSLVVGVVGARQAGSFPGSDQLPALDAVLRLVWRLLLISGWCAVAWCFGWVVRLGPGASLVAWVGATVLLPSLGWAVAERRVVGLGSGLLEIALRGGPIGCAVSGTWPMTRDVSSDSIAVVAGVSLVLYVVVVAWIADDRFWPAPSLK